jgi:DNA-binding NarL/FixJ family response regulator
MFRFLIVDDNENDALLLTQLIEQRYADHVQCFVAGTRQKALWWLDPTEAEPMDCVLLDLNLPDSNGIETFRAVHAAAKPVPIVIYSGRDDERGLIDLLIGEGAEGYIHKGEVKSKQVYETMRDAAQRARYTARVPKNERQHLMDSKERSNRALEQARRSLPPSSDHRLLVEAFAAQQELVSDQSLSLVVLREQIGDIGKRVGDLVKQTHDIDKKAEEATETGRHHAIVHTQLREMTRSNKRKLAAIGAALAGLGYSIGEGREWMFNILGALLGF